MYVFLQGCGIQVISIDSVAAGVHGKTAGGKKPIPGPLKWGGRVFSFQGGGKRDTGPFLPTIGLLEKPGVAQLLPYLGTKAGREQCNPVFVVFARTNNQYLLLEVEVPDSQIQALSQPQSRA